MASAGLLCGLLLTLALLPGEALKILVVNPRFGGSHVLFVGKLADVLAEGGHEVVVLQVLFTDQVKFSGHTDKRIRLIELPGAIEVKPPAGFHEHIWVSDWNFSSMDELARAFRVNCEALLNNTAVMEQLQAENFDLGVMEFFDICPLGLFRRIGLRKYISTFGMSAPLNAMGMLGIPPMPSFVPGMFGRSALGGVLGRTKDFLLFVMSKMFLPRFQGTVAKAFDVFEPGLDVAELLNNSTLIWENADEFAELVKPTSPKLIPIGGVGMRAALEKSTGGQLDARWQKVYDSAKKGVVYMSFGSVAKSESMPAQIKRSFLEAFAEFPEVQFIWKFENDTEDVAKGFPNVHTGKWLPQRQILLHPRTLAFITHSGQNSITEATWSGVPLLQVPLFGDQFKNAGTAKQRGIALVIYKQDLLTKTALVNALRQLIDTDTYRLKARQLSNILRSKPQSAEQRILDSVEMAARFELADLLNSDGRNMSTVAFYNLDVYLLLFSGTLLLLALFYALLKLVLRCACRCVGRKAKRD